MRNDDVYRGRKRNQWFRTRCWGCCSYSCGSERSTSSRLLFLMVQVHKLYIQCLQTAVHTHTNSFVLFFFKKGLVFLCKHLTSSLCFAVDFWHFFVFDVAFLAIQTWHLSNLHYLYDVFLTSGKAGEMIDRGDNTYGGKYVVNPSGGLISKGHPLGATGAFTSLNWGRCKMDLKRCSFQNVH